MYNRLTYSLSKKEYLLVGKMLESVIEKFCMEVSISTIEDLTHFFCSIMHINPEYIHNTIDNLISVYAGYFKKDMSQAIYLFDFKFLGYVCGMSLLGGHRATSIEKKSANAIVSVIPEKELAEVITKCLPRDWHTIHPIMYLIARYDREKTKRIVDYIDVNRLTEKAKNCWGQCREITALCDILYTGSHKVAKSFIKDNIDKIQIMYSFFIIISPRSAIEAFDRGIKIDLLTEHWWDISLFALLQLHKIDAKKTKEILLKNVSKISERISSVTALDFNEKYCLEFLKQIQKIDTGIFDMIVAELDIAKIEKNWSRGAIHKRKEKQVEKRREQFYELISNKPER